MQAIPVQQRFESKVAYEPLCGCHLWTGAVNKFGYGKLSVGGNKWEFAHRISYKLHKGEIPEDMCVLHTCDNPACVNPEHLYLGDYKQNANDRETRNRGNHAIGTRHGRCKLTPDKVREMRQTYNAHKFSFRQLGKIYGVDGKTAGDIVRNKLWQSLH